MKQDLCHFLPSASFSSAWKTGLSHSGQWGNDDEGDNDTGWTPSSNVAPVVPSDDALEAGFAVVGAIVAATAGRVIGTAAKAEYVASLRDFLGRGLLGMGGGDAGAVEARGSFGR